MKKAFLKERKSDRALRFYALGVVAFDAAAAAGLMLLIF
jgi:hypothetical protein